MPYKNDSVQRDHLFISYASEDEAFAEWLALRLTAEGYKVWIACFELLGGEAFPEDIDRAIKDRTFRLLGLLSEHSLHKPDPLAERTLGWNLGKERDEDFLIPINIDGLSPTELDWRMASLTFIPFRHSWGKGLAQLIKKLEKEEAPKGAQNGRRVAASVYLNDELLSLEPEQVYANLIRFESIPEIIQCFEPFRRLSPKERNILADEWGFWALPGRVGRGEYFSFTGPPDEAPEVGRLSWGLGEAAKWRVADSLKGKKTEHVLKPLLRRTILHHLRRKGLRPVSAKKSTVLYFPRSLLPDDKLFFSMPDGRSTHRRVVGERAFPNGGRFRYHQAVTVDVLRDLGPEFIVKFRIKLHITDRDGEPLDPVSANARRKYMTKDWWNEEWLARHLAICSFMSNDDGRIVIGDEDPLILSDSLLQLEAPRGINEEAVPKGTPRYMWMNYASDDDGDEDELGSDS